MVICSSIKEAKVIEENLKKRMHIEEFDIEPSLIKKEDYKESIILYTRSDLEKENIKDKKKRIILSTNLGGRGTDIRTTESDEEAGGLHVILTYMPRNYRVLKQAFGRTSREGKKGTGQIIIGNTGYISYSDVQKEMNENEKKEISYIQKNLRILLFKDKLFEEYIKLTKCVNSQSHLIDDINQRWAQFLWDNITSKGNDLNTEEVKEKFEIFKGQINSILKDVNIHNQFQNQFYQMKEGLRKHRFYDKN